jgi:peroxiredoxin
MSNLKEQLDQLNDELIKNIPTELIETVQKDLLNLAENKIATGLPVGSKAPNFVLPDATGKQISLQDKLEKGPVVLSFYRGEWCPYCNLELRALDEALPEIQSFDASLIAISPENPDQSLSVVEKHNLKFPVLSDAQGEVMQQYNLVWTFSDELKEHYKKIFNLDLAERTKAGWVLPVPATLVIDRNGVIQESFVNPDYTKRLEPSRIIEVLRSIQ